MNNIENPDHPVVKEMEQQWHKICAIIMFKLRQHEIEIDLEELEALANGPFTNIVVDTRGGTKLRLRLVNRENAERMIAEDGK